MITEYIHVDKHTLYYVVLEYTRGSKGRLEIYGPPEST